MKDEHEILYENLKNLEINCKKLRQKIESKFVNKNKNFKNNKQNHNIDTILLYSIINFILISLIRYLFKV